MGDTIGVDVRTALLKQVYEWDAGIDIEDFVLAFDLIESEEDLRTALDNPADLLEKLYEGLGPEAKRFMIAKLRPKLTETFQNHGLKWEEA